MSDHHRLSAEELSVLIQEAVDDVHEPGEPYDECDPQIVRIVRRAVRDAVRRAS